jgi:hypothetical protein
MTAFISAAGWDSYFTRQAALEAARQRACPFCQVTACGLCTDRYGQPTSFVHPGRMALAAPEGWTDPYPLMEA